MRVRHSFKLPRLTGKIGMLLGLSLFNVAPAHAFDWASLWSTAEQRAAKQFENHQYDELINNAPDANWRGLGEYRKGDYAAAAKSFEQQRMQAEHAGRNTGLDKNVQQAAVERAMYNQANAHVLEENYPAAIDMFDELLESNPQHANAQHNRNIAQQLLEQQQQEQQQESGEQGEQSDENQSESGDKQDKEDGQGQQDQQDSQSGDGEQPESQNAEQGEEQEQEGQSGQQADDNSEQASAQQQAEEDAAAAAAMESERQNQADAEQNENASESESAEAAAPLTEREQANEQWLRQIPDDPAGLLQRKIQNRHLTDFPKVIDSDKPW